MSSTYTPSLTLTQIGNGEQSGTWGTTTNNNWQLIEDAVAGIASISLSGTSSHTLSVANGTSDEARKAVLVATGATSGTCAIIAPLEPKVYLVSNQTSGGFNITIGATTGSVVTIPNGVTTLVYCDGTNFNSGITGFAGGNLTITGNIVASGSITASTINASLYGGAANQLVYQSGANSTSYISAPPSSGSATLLTYTPGSGFSWGTGSVSSLAGGTANSVVYQSSPGSTQFLTNPGSSGTYYLTYNNGLLWSTGGSVASVTASSPIGSTGGSNPNISLTGLVPIANGGTNAATASQALTNLGAGGLVTTNTWTGQNTFGNNGAGTGTPIYGVTNSTTAASGYVGELVSAAGSGVALTSDVTQTVATLSLPAGDWDIFGTVYTNSSSVSSFICAANVTTTIVGSVGFYASTAMGPISMPIPFTPTQVTTTTNIYLLVNVGFTGTATANGNIYARRRR
jgi:hypothetical protein